MVLDWWRAAAVARGVMQGLESGAAGFRLGMRYQALAFAPGVHAGRRHGDFTDLVCLAPFSIWMAGILPVLQSPVFVAVYAAASTLSLLQAPFMAVAGMHAGWVSGFFQGASSTLATGLHGVSRTAGVAVRAVLAVLSGLLGGRR